MENVARLRKLACPACIFISCTKNRKWNIQVNVNNYGPDYREIYKFAYKVFVVDLGVY